MKKNGFFVISLDFELLWGIFDLVNHREKEEYFLNTRKILPAILENFEQSGVHATWAVVGMLFNNNWTEWKNNRPTVIPTYNDPSLCPYSFGNSIFFQETENFVFAPELIQQIKNTKGQEIGTHTYSHYYCLEGGQNKEQFAADLQKAIEVAAKMDIKIRSLVFPRNQLKEEYLKICTDLGIKSVRSNPSSWYWKDASSKAFATKVARSGDVYLPFGKKTYPVDALVQKENMPLEQKSSRFCRPVEKNSLMRMMKLNRIRNEMTRAAKKNEIYHLWWHPHNYGQQPAESLKDLDIILKHYVRCREKYGFRSCNMQEMYKFSKSNS